MLVKFRRDEYVKKIEKRINEELRDERHQLLMLIEQQKAKEQVTEKINFSKANRKENPLTYASTSCPKDISFGAPC